MHLLNFGEKNGQRTGNKTVVDGWFDEMCYKTVFRAAYDNITIDSEKITKHIADAIQLENNYYYSNDEKTTLSEMKKEVKSSAGSGQTIKIRNIEEAEIVPDNVDKETGEITDPNDDNPIFQKWKSKLLELDQKAIAIFLQMREETLSSWN